MKVLSLVLGLMLASVGFAHDRATTDVVDTAVAAGQFKTLVTAVQAAGLVDALKGEGPFTVFAPNDAAFAKLPAGTVEALLNDIPSLTKILTYHVVAGELTKSDLVRQRDVATLQGQEVEARSFRRGLFGKRSLYINQAKIVGEVRVKNGVIYIIDSVLLPQ